jgi:D-glycero-D-manno-heptose 1,7-bisphosphate phosphatase
MMSCPYTSTRSIRSLALIEQAASQSDRRFLFLDRDGVINDDIGTYVRNIEMFRIREDAIQAIVDAYQKGWLINICTNQPGISKGLMSHQDLERIHSFLRSYIESRGGVLCDIVYCIHAREFPCNCRKPNSGMLDYLADLYHMTNEEIRRSWFVGDHTRDLAASRVFGCNFAGIVGAGLQNENNQTFRVYGSLRDFVNEQL